MTNESVELRLSNTNISLKRGTKKLLDELGTRKDSYDDIIRKLIKENQRLKSLVEQESLNINKLKISKVETKETSITLPNWKIFFQHDIPQKPLGEFRFNIIYTKILTKKGEMPLTNFGDALHMAESYLRIYEKLVRTYIDPLFKISKRHVFDLEWWKRKLLNLGFSNKTYKEDIENKLIQLGVLP
jgi:hypothetical protein